MSYNVLIVDDSVTVRQVVARSLELAGVPISQAFQAENGKAGLEVLQKEWIDLVLCDLSMPIMDGVTMVRHMQEDGILQSIPVIIVTADGSKHKIDELLAQGVTDYIRKPFTPEQLRDVVFKCMGDPNG
tara:strand:- start:78 stop:464 length:387 start_codon:yes stop_codon:yes gene_type:complete